MRVEPVAETLRMFGQPTEGPPLDWPWVLDRLAAAGPLWVVPTTGDAGEHPHPRPVWGVWADDRFFLSIGSPVVRRRLAADPAVTVHVDSGTEVVIVEGRFVGFRSEPDVIALYDRKYDYSYDAAAYGPLTEVVATTVYAWRAAGVAGCEGFRENGCWRFPAR